MAKKLPSAERLQELLRVDFDGGLWWRSRGRGKSKARLAGYENKAGYRVIQVDGELYYAHRLLWKLITEKDPEGVIDHIDGNTRNNRQTNLQDISQKRSANGK